MADPGRKRVAWCSLFAHAFTLPASAELASRHDRGESKHRCPRPGLELYELRIELALNVTSLTKVGGGISGHFRLLEMLPAKKKKKKANAPDRCVSVVVVEALHRLGFPLHVPALASMQEAGVQLTEAS